MRQVVYVDVLLVVNYVINMLLLACLCKCTGRRARRCRLVASALIGAAGSLGIFLPFQGFFISVLARLLLSALMVRTAFAWAGLGTFLREWFLFFAVSFFFAGVMLGIWMSVRPSQMIYHNGIVYFDISAAGLLACTVLAYLLLGVWQRFSRGGRLGHRVYDATLFYRGRRTRVSALADTGNQLYEPFSDAPVMVCGLAVAAALLPAEVCASILSGQYAAAGTFGVPLRMVPFSSVGSEGLLPAFRVDSAWLARGREEWRVENLYVGISRRDIGGNGYNAILNPDLVGVMQARPVRESKVPKQGNMSEGGN